MRLPVRPWESSQKVQGKQPKINDIKTDVFRFIICSKQINIFGSGNH